MPAVIFDTWATEWTRCSDIFPTLLFTSCNYKYMNNSHSRLLNSLRSKFRVHSSWLVVIKIDSAEWHNAAATHQQGTCIACCITHALYFLITHQVSSEGKKKPLSFVWVLEKGWLWPINVGNHKPPTTHECVSEGPHHWNDAYLYIFYGILHLFTRLFCKYMFLLL